MIDETKLKTVANYAKSYKKKNGEIGATPAFIYKLIKEDRVNLILIDGVRFIVLDC